MGNTTDPLPKPSSSPIKTFGQQLLVFLIVLNLGALYGLTRLFQKTEHVKADMEAQKVTYSRDSLKQVALIDSLRAALLVKPVQDTLVAK